MNTKPIGFKTKKPMKNRVFRCPDDEWEKVLRNGGGEWLRGLIKKAREVSHGTD